MLAEWVWLPVEEMTGTVLLVLRGPLGMDSCLMNYWYNGDGVLRTGNSISSVGSVGSVGGNTCLEEADSG